MIELAINGKTYELKNDFKDLTLSQGKELHKIIFNAPKSLQELYNATTQKELDAIEVSDKDVLKAYPKFYGEVLGYCGDIPEKVIGKVLSTERIEIFKGYLESLVMDIVHLPKEIKEIKKFKWNGINYYLPQAKTVVGAERLGAGMAALEFTEESDVRLFSKGLEGGMYENAANVISILARPKGEKYDEEVSLGRVEMFMDLPLDVVHSVFFSLVNSMRKYSIGMVDSLVRQELSRKERVTQRNLASLDGTGRYLA